MADSIRLHYDVSGTDFTLAGAASSDVKRTLKQLGVSPTAIRNVAIAMYEGEINMVIHAGGGEIDVDNHIDFALIHSNSYISYGCGCYAKLFKGTLDIT